MPRRRLRRRGGIAPTQSRLGTRWGEWSASRPGRALAPGKGPPVPIVQEAGWVPEPVWTQARGNILLPLPGKEPRLPGRPVRSQTLYWLSYLAHIPVYKSSIVMSGVSSWMCFMQAWVVFFIYLFFRRATDGIHWLPMPVRHMTNLLLTHIGKLYFTYIQHYTYTSVVCYFWLCINKLTGCSQWHGRCCPIVRASVLICFVLPFFSFVLELPTAW
jgi:hypothetical protein